MIDNMPTTTQEEIDSYNDEVLYSLEEGFDKVWKSKSVKRNKCPFCDYKCKTTGWVNGVIQHIKTNHNDRFTPISLYERVLDFIKKRIELAEQQGYAKGYRDCQNYKGPTGGPKGSL